MRERARETDGEQENTGGEREERKAGGGSRVCEGESDGSVELREGPC